MTNKISESETLTLVFFFFFSLHHNNDRHSNGSFYRFEHELIGTAKKGPDNGKKTGPTIHLHLENGTVGSLSVLLHLRGGEGIWRCLKPRRTPTSTTSATPPPLNPHRYTPNPSTPENYTPCNYRSLIKAGVAENGKGTLP